MTIVELFKQLAITSGKIDKENLLRHFQYEQKDLISPRSEGEPLKECLRLIYDKDVKFDLKSTSVTLKKYGKNKDLPYWLYFPLTGIKGRTRKIEYLQRELSRYTPEVCRWFLKGLDKDLGIGINSKIINKVFKGLISDFPVMLAERQTREKFDKTFGDTEEVYLNLKIDGIRCLCFVRSEDNIEFYSRAGFHLQDILVELIKKEIQRNIDQFKGYVFDGEIFSNKFHQLQRLIMRKNLTSDTIGLRNSCRFAIFDMMTIDRFESGREIGYVEEPLSRRVELMKLFKEYNFIKFTKYIKVKRDYTYILTLMKYYLQRGYEGLMVKHPDSFYYFKRVYQWMKFKAKDNLDLEVIDFVEGKGKYVGKLGALRVDFDGVVVEVGTGFSDEEREHIWKNRDQIKGKIVEISYREITHLGSLKDPRFECIRFDKGEINEDRS